MSESKAKSLTCKQVDPPTLWCAGCRANEECLDPRQQYTYPGLKYPEKDKPAPTIPAQIIGGAFVFCVVFLVLALTAWGVYAIYQAAT